MNNNKQLNKGDKMRKMIASVLVVLALSASMISPSQAYWTTIGNGVYWCDYTGCR